MPKYLNEIKTPHPWHPNTSIEFNANGIWMRVSLNVTKDVATRLSPNNVKMGKVHCVYALRMFIESSAICKDTMEQVQRMLLDNCMKNVRIAKEKLKCQTN